MPKGIEQFKTLFVSGRMPREEAEDMVQGQVAEPNRFIICKFLDKEREVSAQTTRNPYRMERLNFSREFLLKDMQEADIVLLRHKLPSPN
jgi:hypothetical protein